MLHTHVHAEPCSHGFKAVIEGYDHGAKLWAIEGDKHQKTMQLAMAYAQRLGAAIMKDISSS